MPNQSPTPDGEALEEIHARESGQLRMRLLAPKDRMKVFLEAEPLSGPLERRLDRASLLGYFPNLIPSELLHAEVLDDVAALLSAGKKVESRRIARGREAVPGRDGKIVLLVKAFQRTGAREVVDPWYFKAFDSVEAMTPVARLYPPHPGAPGLDCVGRPVLPMPCAPAAVETDDTLELQPGAAGRQFDTVVAKIAGYLTTDRSKLRIVHELVLEGNVDHHSGDVRFVGAVTVAGDVMKDFRVHAREGITIRGNVMHGRLSNESGDIAITGVATGDPSVFVAIRERVPIGSPRAGGVSRVQISSAGEFRAHALDGVTVEALGNIVISKEIRASVIHTRGSVMVPDGRVIAGEIHAVCGVEAKSFGTESGVTTTVRLASDIESTAEYEALVTQLKNHESALEMIRLYLGPYAERPSRTAALPPDLRKRMEGLLKKLAEVTRSREALVEARQSMLARARHNSVYRINVLGIAHAGTVFCAGEACMTLHEPIVGKKTIEFLAADNTFHVGDLQPLECTVSPAGAP